jgi:hypothetical protein
VEPPMAPPLEKDFLLKVPLEKDVRIIFDIDSTVKFK